MSQHIDISCYILGPYYGVILTLKTTPICIALNTFYVTLQARAFYGFQIAIENIHSGKTKPPHLSCVQSCLCVAVTLCHRCAC